MTTLQYNGLVAQRCRLKMLEFIMEKREVTPEERLRSCIKNAGINEAEFALMAEISRTTLSKYLNGSRKMSDNFLFKAARLL
ncbi:MAG: helix-turn-helix transcriptional regulator, partial [Butyrivibrio sp.]|nr:helix-turn-helix transcriptional regulator [Butyrivibrio sp.]